MDANPEQLMETDVSSTTADVPETQEVTESYGDVQITVEKVEDEEIKAFEQEPHTELPTDVTPSSSEDALLSLEKSPPKLSTAYSDQGTSLSIKTPTKSPTSLTDSLPSITHVSQDSPQKVLIPIRSYSSPAKNATKCSPQKVGTPTKSLSSLSIESPSTTAVQSPPKPQNMKEAADSSSQIETDIAEKSSEDSDKDIVQNVISGSKEDVTFECKSPSALNSSSSENKNCFEHSEDTQPELIKKTDELDEDDIKKSEALAKSHLLETDAETSNDSHSYTSEHNKNISRELKSLMNSAKESKIINECTQITSKMRKSRSGLDSSNTSLNISQEEEKPTKVRRHSTNSENSTCSEKSEKVTQKRSMRSQNPEFANKVKVFLNSVTGKGNKLDLDSSYTEDNSKKAKVKGSDKEKDVSLNNSISSPARKKKKLDGPEKVENKNRIAIDSYCWRCHYSSEQTANEKSPPAQCTVCPRSFHYKCLTVPERNTIGSSTEMWVCPECVNILNAESSEHRSPAMKRISLGMLCELLKHALDRMLDLHGVEPFTRPVDRNSFPLYDKYVVHPMDLAQMKKNLEQGMYGSTEAFLADAQWILHNSIIFNTLKSNLTAVARSMVRLCRTEISEIEACPECYAGAYARKPTWFTDVCSTPHILLWAKLKGFPYWPAKGMSISSNGLVDVRFFGAHDRAWVPARDCFLYSEKDPNNFKAKRQDIIDSMQEAEQHIRNISRKYGKFVYPPFKILLDPPNLHLQLKLMIPSFDGEIKMPSHLKDKLASSPKVKKRHSSTSKDVHDSDMSDADEEASVKLRKMADGAEIARVEDDEKDKTMEVDTPNKTPSVLTRKRRKSQFLVEAVATVIETSSSEKRKRLDTEGNSENQGDAKKESAKETLQKASLSDKGKEVIKNNKDTSKTQTVITRFVISNSTTTPQSNKSSTTDATKTKIGQPKKEEKPTEVTPKPNKITLVRLKPKPSESPKQNKSQTVNVEKSETPKVKTNKDKQKAIEKQNENKGDVNGKIPSDKEKSLDRSASGVSTNNLTPSFSKVTTNKKEELKKKQSTVESSDKPNESSSKKSEKYTPTPKTSDKNISSKSEKSSSGVKKSSTPKIKKSIADRILFDDDTSLAILAKGSKNDNVVLNIPGMPAITDIRSLSSNEKQNPIPSTSKSTGNVMESSSDSRVFTPTSSDSIKTMKDAITKLQTLKETEPRPQVGRVGVKAFARMKSPERNTNEKRKQVVQVEIKAEPMDYDDSERLSEKLNLMNACKLQPVKVTSSSNLREVRISKQAPTTSTQIAKVIGKVTETKTMAKKTFPQPKKVVGGSELNSKNSMVYIPIQPPVSKPPPSKNARQVPTVVSSTASGGASILRLPTPISSSMNSGNNTVNTVTTPMLPSSLPLISSSTSTTNVNTVVPTPTVQMPTMGPLANAGSLANAGHLMQVLGGPQVPSSVHTVPLITSVNGQWTFSLQPVMSVGDGISTPPLVNGLPDRNAPIMATPPGIITGLPNMGNTQVPRPSNENAPGEPPRLQQKPPLMHPLDPAFSYGIVPVPSTAGPVTAKLNQNAMKLTDFFRMLLVDTLDKLDEPTASNAALRFHLEQAQWRQKQEIKEIQHNHGLLVAELRASFEKEKTRAVAEVRKAAQIELEAAVKHAKSKLWCANCSQEAQFYCCWNTAYCDLSCQKSHWPQHFTVCTQKRTGESGDSPSKDQNRPHSSPPEVTPKTPVPTLTAGNKVTSTQSTQKPSIIVLDDPNVKCISAFKPAVSAAQLVSLNKQLMNNEENKKAVTTGGYLIIGGGTGTSPSIVSAARPSNKSNNNGPFFS